MSWMAKCIDGMLCGGVTGCIAAAVILIFGVPLFTAGVAMVAMFGMEGESTASQAGRVMLAMAMLLVVGGVATVIYMCRMGPTFLKTTPARKKKTVDESPPYQRFPSGDTNVAPPAYEESSHHARYYPDGSATQQGGYQSQGGYPIHSEYPNQSGYHNLSGYPQQHIPQQSEKQETKSAPSAQQEAQHRPPGFAPCDIPTQATTDFVPFVPHVTPGTNGWISFTDRPKGSWMQIPQNVADVPPAPAYGTLNRRAAAAGPSAPPLPAYSPVAPSGKNSGHLPCKT